MIIKDEEFITIKSYLLSKKIKYNDDTIEKLDILCSKYTSLFKLAYKKTKGELYFTKIVISFVFKELRGF